jgi:hypothetical protein
MCIFVHFKFAIRLPLFSSVGLGDLSHSSWWLLLGALSVLPLLLIGLYLKMNLVQFFVYANQYLEYAESLISTDADAPNVIINDLLTVTTSSAVFTAAQLARVNAVTNKIGTVLGVVTANNSAASTTAIEFNALAFADAAVNFTGAPTIPLLKTVSGAMTLAGYTGDLDYSTITNIGGAFEVNSGITSLNLAGVTIAGAISTTGSASGQLNLPSATSVDVGTAAVIYVDADKATTVKLGNTGTAASLQVDAALATRVDIAATEITTTFGTAVGTPTNVFANSIAKIVGAATVSAAAQFHATSLVQTGGASTIAAEIVNLPLWSGTASATMSMSGAHTAGLNLPAAVLVTGNPLTAAAAKIITVLSTDAVALNSTAAENLTITGLADTTDFITDAGFAALKTLSITGVADAAPSDTTQTNSVGVTVAAAALTDLTVGGTVHDVYGVAAALLKNVTLTGAIGDITMATLVKLENLAIGTSHIEGASASVVSITGNTILASVKPTAMSEVKSIQISTNAALAEIDFSALTVIPTGTFVGTWTLAANKLSGSYVRYVAATETADAVETIIKSNDVNSLKAYITATNTAGNTPTIAIDIEEMKIGSAAALTLDQQITAEDATGHTIVGNLDTIAELALVTTE